MDFFTLKQRLYNDLCIWRGLIIASGSRRKSDISRLARRERDRKNRGGAGIKIEYNTALLTSLETVTTIPTCRLIYVTAMPTKEYQMKIFEE